jgi:hypothetical protein
MASSGRNAKKSKTNRKRISKAGIRFKANAGKAAEGSRDRENPTYLRSATDDPSKPHVPLKDRFQDHLKEKRKPLIERIEPLPLIERLGPPPRRQ